jgi:tRNA threonylcarbamoyladenosine biosynthesis protein TsaB
MNRLAFESSGAWCSVALEVHGQVLTRQQHSQRGHAELLLPWVDEVLAESGLHYGDLNALAVSHGPGSFTSLRIGLGIMQGIALAHDLPIHPVSSLDATAEAHDPACQIAHLMVITDARMGEVYAAQYGLKAGRRHRLTDPYLTTIDALPSIADGQQWAAVGSGADHYAQALAERFKASEMLVTPNIWPTAAAVLRLADGVVPVAGWSLEPLYLRHKVAHQSGD